MAEDRVKIDAALKGNAFGTGHGYEYPEPVVG